MAVSGVGSGPSQQKNAQLAAQEAEKDALNRIASAQEHVRQTEREADAEIERLQKAYAQQRDSYIARSEESLSNDQEKGYQALLESKRRQQAEITRLQREGETSVDTARSYYEKAAADAEADGKAKLYHEEKTAQTNLQIQQKRGKGEAESENRQHQLNLQNLQQQHLSRSQTLQQMYDQEFATERERYLQARALTEKNFQENFQNSSQQNAKVLNDLNQRASEQVREIRHDTSRKLDAYAGRQNDPFYKMVDIGARLSESDTAYVIRTPVPPQERDNVSVVIQGDRIVVSGYRRNEEKLELDPGHVKSSAAYQTYSESFPITWPVEPKEMRKEFQGNELVVTIPKKLHPTAVKKAESKPDKLRAEKPYFPPDLALGEDSSPETKKQGPRKSQPLGWDT